MSLNRPTSTAPAPEPPPAPAAAPGVVAMAHLGPRLLVGVGRFPEAYRTSLAETEGADLCLLPLTSPDADQHAITHAFLLRVPEYYAEKDLPWHSEALAQGVVDLQVLLRTYLAPRSAECRNAFTTFCASILVADEAAPVARQTTEANLRLVRAALRERLPVDPAALEVKEILALDDCWFWLRGRATGGSQPMRDLVVVSPAGARVKLAAAVGDTDDRSAVGASQDRSVRLWPSAGSTFVAQFCGGAPSASPEEWVLECRTAEGAEVEARAPSVQRNPALVRSRILRALSDGEVPAVTESRQVGAFPSLLRLNLRADRGATLGRVEQFGEPPARPTASVVIRLRDQLEMMMHQLVQFAADRQFATTAELLYILDGPAVTGRVDGDVEITNGGGDLFDEARQFFELFRVPFRLATLTSAAGRGAALEAGVSLARAQILVLMEETAFPTAPGWLARMAASHAAAPAGGTCSPTFLDAHGQPWRAGEDPGACTLIDRQLFHEIGGFHGGFFGAQAQVAELRWRVAGLGRPHLSVAEVDFHHLPGDADDAGKTVSAQYDQWLLEQAVAAPPREPHAGPTCSSR